MKIESNAKMAIVTDENDMLLICFDEQEVVNEDATMYKYEGVRIPRAEFDYGGIVNAIIRSRYSESQVEAIILNGTDTEEHAEQLRQLQEWRAHAKQVAHEIVG